jgi:hypothetical protein
LAVDGHWEDHRRTGVRNATSVDIYCDESCHLEHDRLPVMLLGALWCPHNETKPSAIRLRDIKERHGLPRDFEVKWTKVSESKIAFYLDVLDYFFDNTNLHSRVIVIRDKHKLRHEDFGQDHDTWYYKMYSLLLTNLISPECTCNVYIDIKDTRSRSKVETLHQVLRNTHHDYDKSIIRKIQQVRSHEVEHVQLIDLLIGAIGYANRGLSGNAGKVALVERMRSRTRYSLQKTTLLREDKVNILVWEPQKENLQ